MNPRVTNFGGTDRVPQFLMAVPPELALYAKSIVRNCLLEQIIFYVLISILLKKREYISIKTKLISLLVESWYL
jgi:hypothetical protein